MPSVFQDCEGGVDPRTKSKKGTQTIGKIKKALDFMRNQQLEVPFIAFYRKEYVLPELTISDLWKVYKYDAKVSTGTLILKVLGSISCEINS
jgi:Transcriptional accessory protein